MQPLRNFHLPAGHLLLLAIILLFTLAVSNFQEASTNQQTDSQRWPTRRELWRSMRRNSVAIYPGAPAKICQAYQALYQEQQSQRYLLRRRFLSDQQFPADSLGHLPLMLVGSLQSHQLLKQIIAELPLQIIPGGFRFRGVDYTDSTDVLYLAYPNPRNRAMLLMILTGNTDAAIVRYQKQQEWRNFMMGDFILLRQARAIAFGFFQDTGLHAWNPEKAQAYDLFQKQKSAKQTLHFSFVTHGASISAAAIDTLAQHQEANLQKLIARLGIAATVEVPRLTIHLWDSFEEKGLFTGETRLSHTDETRNPDESGRSEIHLAFTNDLRGDDFTEEAKWLVNRLVGQTPSPALREGLAIALSDNWRGVGHRGWAARLLQTGNAPPLDELLQSKIWTAESDLVRQPLLGSLAEFLLERWGSEEFLRAYRHWPEDSFPAKLPNGDTPQRVLAEWEKYVRSLPAIPLRHQSVPKSFISNFHRGFCYAHEGYQIRNGYLGSMSQQALAKLAELHVTEISVTPFGYLSAPDQPDFLRRSSSARSENDESLVQAKFFAKRYDMGVMLKPHILMRGRDWGWPGAIKMKSAEEWSIFFNRYARWMLHYAMLAEIYDFDSLCIGVELVNASYPHERVWREMIRRWRGIYSGPMIYAANWGEEFENIAFWDALDAIGLNCYYPLSEKEDPADDDLLRGAQQVAEKIGAVVEKFPKPVLITEIGFISSGQPWRRPHYDDSMERLNLEAQRRCYEGMFHALWGKPWLAGIYWWKWPTTLDDGGTEDDGFTPNGKPAAVVVARWYGREFPR